MPVTVRAGWRSAWGAPWALRHKQNGEEMSPLEHDAEQRKQAEQATILEFLRLWLASGLQRVSATDLLEFADAAKLPIFGSTRKGRLVGLGVWLNEHRKEVFTSDTTAFQFNTTERLIGGRQGYRIASSALSPSETVANFTRLHIWAQNEPETGAG
jgi:hypothetical protein